MSATSNHLLFYIQQMVLQNADLLTCPNLYPETITNEEMMFTAFYIQDLGMH